MRLKTIFLMVVALAEMALAQSAVPPSQAVMPGTQAEAEAPKSVKREAPRPAAKAPAAQKPAASVAKPVSAVKPAARRQARAVRKPSEQLAVQPVEGTQPAAAKAGRRDPFVSPIVRAEAVKGAPCEGVGKKCLAADQVVLRGVVRSPAGMIAVVESTARKISYFLRENDPVFNGYVVKITADSVTFRESTNDSLGRTGTRDIVKRVSAPAV
jgi:hypothetical protein